ncbi:MAG: tRNA (pseudouridine(54)-N(1))-methyltransferase TrmY [Nanoarchaeota archaeon]|nr:tRNA (pseudouridine(54)-N(1))-methyltransferase TrmY [Nanoarchaeota archaeon]
MTRTFIMYSHGTTDDFNIDHLYESGRIDVICRCVLGALWVSEAMRKDTQIIVILNSGKRPPVSIKFDGNKMIGIEPSERSIALVIKKSLNTVKDKEWTNVQTGISVSRKSFQDLIKEAKNIFILSVKGSQTTSLKVENPTFVLGDNKGIPKNEESFALRKGERISLGSRTYLASSIVSTVHWLLDQ